MDYATYAPKAHGFSRGFFSATNHPRLKTWAFAVLSVALLAGCGSDDEPGVTADFNGDAFAADTFTAAYYPAQRSKDGGNRPERPITGLEDSTGRFQLNAKSGDRVGNGQEPKREFAITLSGIDGPGTYPIVRGDADIQSFQLYAKDNTGEPVEYYAPVGDEQIGTLNLDEVSPDVVGTINFKLVSADGQKLDVSNGKFRVENVVPKAK